jgi:tetratricopeptide (TPR) repeat protein
MTNAELKQGMELHRQGRLEEAALKYRLALQQDAQNYDAHNLLGLVRQAQGALDQALKQYDEALVINPRAASVYFNRGNLLLELHRPADAIDSYKRALEVRPQYPDALLNLGVALQSFRDAAAALNAFKTLIALTPNDARAHFNAARCFLELGDRAEAEDALKQAVAFAPAFAEAKIALAELYASTKRLPQAIALLREALERAGSTPELHSTLGSWLMEVNDHAAAIEAHLIAVRMAPDRGEFLYNLGLAYYADGQLQNAIVSFQNAIRRKPALTGAYVNLGQALSDANNFDEAIMAFNNVLTPNLGLEVSAQEKTAAFTNKALALLARGDFEEGWRCYRYRVDRSVAALSQTHEELPRWDGRELKNKMLLLWTDQGLGDEILYASMIPDALDRAAHCTIECSDRLLALFQRSFPSATIIPRTAKAGLVPPPDMQSSVPDLGNLFRLSTSAFPLHKGYLAADAIQRSDLRSKYRSLANGRPVIGIAWKSENPSMGRFKTLPLPQWLPIFRSIDAFWVSLQYGDVTSDVAALKADHGIEIFVDGTVNQAGPLDRFAAQVAAVDLVVSVSNTAVHFSGALNVPTWIMVPEGRGCLWYFRNGTASLWYPSARLYRQAVSRDWTVPIAQVTRDLPEWAANFRVHNGH